MSLQLMRTKQQVRECVCACACVSVSVSICHFMHTFIVFYLLFVHACLTSGSATTFIV